jgi:hypothetical protein
MKITTSGWTVLESGTVASMGTSDVVFGFSPGTFSVVVRIVRDESRQSAIEYANDDGKSFRVTFRNPNGLDYGSLVPLEVGKVGTRRLLADLRVSVVGDFDSFRVQYTFFVEGE